MKEINNNKLKIISASLIAIMLFISFTPTVSSFKEHTNNETFENNKINNLNTYTHTVLIEVGTASLRL